MGSENTRIRLSSEFWAIIGSALAIGALMLTVSGWHRSDIQSLRERIAGVEGNLRGEMGSLESNLRGDMSSLETNLRGEVANLETNLRGEIANVETNLRGEIANVETNLRAEIKSLDKGLSGRIDKLEEGQALISARLAVVESHVLGASPVSQLGTDADATL